MGNEHIKGWLAAQSKRLARKKRTRKVEDEPNAPMLYSTRGEPTAVGRRVPGYNQIFANGLNVGAPGEHYAVPGASGGPVHPGWGRLYFGKFRYLIGRLLDPDIAPAREPISTLGVILGVIILGSLALLLALPFLLP